ncbi:MBL fold metallo-hydrolase, partial [Escherichia coli]|nr:MBL fold metallo-hydrolase [Escherichia coli]
MKITQIRNATQIIQYAGKTFLIDPLLAPKGSYPGFAGTARAEIRNPTVELPCDLTTLLNVDALIVTHLHEDHWDETASRVVPKDKLIYVQNEQDAESLNKQGFTHLTVLTDETKFGDITLHKTTGQHGSDRTYADPAMAKRLGAACGVVFQHPTEKTLYLAGDTLWRDDVEATMLTFQPEVVV